MKWKLIVLSLALVTGALVGEEVFQVDPENFSPQEMDEMLSPKWPSDAQLRMWIFQLGVAKYFASKRHWPKSIAEIVEFSMEIPAVKEENIDESHMLVSSMEESIEILAQIEMSDGMAFLLTYKSGDEKIDGLMVFERGETVEEILESTKRSAEWNRIITAVPF